MKRTAATVAAELSIRSPKLVTLLVSYSQLLLDGGLVTLKRE